MLAIVARTHVWIPVVGSELGRFDGHVLTVESAGGDRVRWAIEPGDKLPDGYAPRLLSREAFTALRDGQPDQDRAISWKGQRWAVKDAWDGARLVAELFAAQ